MFFSHRFHGLSQIGKENETLKICRTDINHKALEDFSQRSQSCKRIYLRESVRSVGLILTTKYTKGTEGGIFNG